jgi:hypothetical protein
LSYPLNTKKFPALKLFYFFLDLSLNCLELPHLAAGSYGTVYKGKVPGIEQTVVIKDMNIISEHSVQEWQKEIAVMAYVLAPPSFYFPFSLSTSLSFYCGDPLPPSLIPK